MKICISTKFDIGQTVYAIMNLLDNMGNPKLYIHEVEIERINFSTNINKEGTLVSHENYTIRRVDDERMLYSGFLPDALYLTRQEAEDVLFDIEEETKKYLSNKPHFRSFKD